MVRTRRNALSVRRMRAVNHASSPSQQNAEVTARMTARHRTTAPPLQGLQVVLICSGHDIRRTGHATWASCGNGGEKTILQAGNRLRGGFVSLAAPMGPIGRQSTELPETACCNDSANPYPCSLDVPCINNHVAHPTERSFVPPSTTFATRVHQQLQLSTRYISNLVA
jgi:hypothetical protein